MNIGDKVRVLRGKEEGIVTRIIDNKLIEIEIEDGFQIPVLRNEVVIVAKEEDSYFKPERSSSVNTGGSTKTATAARKTEEGLFLAFRPLNDRILAVYLINEHIEQVPYAVFEESRNGLKGIANGNLAEGSFHKLAEVSLQNFEEWPSYVFQFLFFSSRITSKLRLPFQKKVHFKAASFYKSRRVAPVLNAEAYTFRLDGDAISVSPEQLQEKLENSRPDASGAFVPAPTPTLDLHIEKLSPHAAGMSSQEILNLQLSNFEKHLDQAIAAGLDEVVYIHGVGNGTLRDAIHKRLSQLSNINFFKDAQKDKFGYGATLVQIK